MVVVEINRSLDLIRTTRQLTSGLAPVLADEGEEPVLDLVHLLLEAGGCHKVEAEFGASF